MCETKENRGSLPSYAWSPWKEGRSKEEQRELQEIQEIRIPDGVRELGNYTFYGCRNLMTLEMTDSVKTIGGGSFTGCGALRRLHVLMEPGGTSCIRDVVSETFHEVYVSISRQIKLKVNYTTSGGQRGDITEIGEYNIFK